MQLREIGGEMFEAKIESGRRGNEGKTKIDRKNRLFDSCLTLQWMRVRKIEERGRKHVFDVFIC